MDNSWCCAIILGWTAMLSRARLCHAAQKSHFPSPVASEVSLAPYLVLDSELGETDLYRSRKPFSSSSSACPLHLLKGSPIVKRHRPALQLGGCCPGNTFCLFFNLQGQPRGWEADKDFLLGATKSILTLVGSVPRAVALELPLGCRS